MASGFAEYRDLATPHLRAILQQLSPAQRRALLARLGKELEIQLKKHFAVRDREGNKRGFPRQHFWSREVRNKTAFREATPDKATVGIDSPAFAHRVTGGVIRPGPGRRALAIPLRPEAYGVLPRAGTIPGLFAARSGGKVWLAAREGGAVRFYWRLVPSVYQDADPNALPPASQLKAALEKRADQEVQRIVQQAK